MATTENPLFRAAELREAGVSRSALRYGLRTGEWVCLRRGVFCTGTTYAGDDEHHFVLAVRAALLVAPGAVASHTTAARLWRLARGGPQPDDGLIHLAARHRVTLAGCVVHRAVDVVATVRVRWVAATGLARTVVDCAHILAFREAVVLIDSALHGDPSLDLGSALSASAGQRGAPAARRALAFADERTESVLESLARVLWHESGLPAPQVQLSLRAGGRFIGRVDFCWPAARLVVEVDGLGKYDELGELQREKQRQNALVLAGYTVLRFGWADVVYRPGPTVALVRGALAG